MDPTSGSQNLESGQATTSSAKGRRLWQLGMTSAMSPSMMASSGPPLDSMSAFAPNMWPSMHHSASTPRLYPDNASSNLGPHPGQSLPGPATFSAPSDAPILSTAVPGQQWGNQVCYPSSFFLQSVVTNAHAHRSQQIGLQMTSFAVRLISRTWSRIVMGARAASSEHLQIVAMEAVPGPTELLAQDSLDLAILEIACRPIFLTFKEVRNQPRHKSTHSNTLLVKDIREHRIMDCLMSAGLPKCTS